jgi:hypothetical protein
LKKVERANDLVVRLMEGEGRRNQLEDRSFKNVVIDIKVRLEQLVITLDRFQQGHAAWRETFAAAFRFPPGEQRSQLLKRADRFQNEFRLDAETFYSVAWRVRENCEVIKNKIDPEIDLTFEPIGVRDVRHHLIEHPGKDDGEYVLSWMFDCPEGLILQPSWSDGSGGIDKGLYPNADEFIEKLIGKLEIVLASLEART